MKTSNYSAPLRAARSASILLALGTVVLAGCGGGGSSSSKAKPRGKVQINVTWPTAASRVIPVNAQSLLVQVKSGATVVGSGTIVRPASTITLSDVPTGSMNVTATAYPNADATGTALATATVATTVTNGNTASVDITMASTIDHLSVLPNPFILGAGLSSQINVVGYDSSGAVVLIDPSTISFSSSNSGLVAVTSTGLATASTSDGTATVSIAESDSGKTLSLPLNVVPTVTVTPSAPTLSVRGTATFVATVVGPTNTGVTWSIQEGGAGGAITSGGIYTAPTTHGTYHVIATSAADTTRTATATITVSSGNVGVTVH